MKTIQAIAVVSGVIAASAAANAEFFANFDLYNSGLRLQSVDGWKGWDNASGVAGLASNAFAYSGSKSLQVTGTVQSTTDAVHQFAGATAGVWSVSAMQYLGSGQAGSTYFILMNKYADGANTNSASWSTQLRFDLGAGRVYDDFRGGSVALATNQWAAIRVDIDLTANTVKHFYNDMLISQGTWTRGASSANALAAIDLYTGAKNNAYYDNVSVSGSSDYNVARIPAQGALATMAVAGLCMMPSRRRR
ncbi:MAG: hypothetical protein KF805_06305 [Phycisphaeraceae bacterium]|nr:hypothetical protein [Phycisphaeraceae bacterium]